MRRRAVEKLRERERWVEKKFWVSSFGIKEAAIWRGRGKGGGRFGEG